MDKDSLGNPMSAHYALQASRERKLKKPFTFFHFLNEPHLPSSALSSGQVTNVLTQTVVHTIGELEALRHMLIVDEAAVVELPGLSLDHQLVMYMMGCLGLFEPLPEDL